MGKTAEKYFLLSAYAAFVVLGIFLFYRIVIDPSTYAIDSALSILGLLVYLWLRKKLHQDTLAGFLALAFLLAHNSGLYGFSLLGLSYDHYMHTLGGIAAACFASRLFFEKMPRLKYLYLIVMVALGMGALVEVTEWFGYAYLGEGEGFLFFGTGDEGEWRNAVLDMLCNLIGAFLFALFTIRKHSKK